MARGVDVLVATPGRLLDHIEPGHDPARPGRDPRARRGRPHARHGLHPRHPADDRHVPARAADPVLLGHHAAGDRGARGRAAERPGQGRGHARSPPRSSGSTQRVIHVDQAAKKTLLAQLLAEPAVTRALVFTRTKHGADHVARHLEACRRRAPRRSTATSRQSQRERALGGFKRRPHARAGRDRHRRPRHRRRRRQPRRQLRPARRARDLRPPHRPHRARRRRGQGDRVLLARRARQLRAIENLIRQQVPVLEVPGSLAAPAERAPGNTAPRSNPAPRRSEPPRDGYRAPRAPRAAAAAPAPTWQGASTFRSSPRPAAAGESRGRTGARRA